MGGGAEGTPASCERDRQRCKQAVVQEVAEEERFRKAEEKARERAEELARQAEPGEEVVEFDGEVQEVAESRT